MVQDQEAGSERRYEDLVTGLLGAEGVTPPRLRPIALPAHRVNELIAAGMTAR